MKKASIEIAKVNDSCLLSFNVIFKNDETDNTPYKKNQSEVVSYFTIRNNNYIKIRPHPFITINISSWMDRQENNTWNTNLSINLNRLDCFRMRNSLNKMVKNFVEIKELYYYQDNILQLSKEYADKIQIVMHTSTNKAILIRPTILENNLGRYANDKESTERSEGVILAINSIDNYCYLTYLELCYLLDVLNKVDFDNLTLNLISFAFHIVRIPLQNDNLNSKYKALETEVDVSSLENTLYVSKNNNTIPSFDDG